MILTTIYLQTIILIIWFKTEAFTEYCRFIPTLSKLFKVCDFDISYEKDFELTYLTYLRQFHNCFFVRLITCPICLNAWLTIVSVLIIGTDIINNFSTIMFFSLFCYYLFNRMSK